MTRTNGASVTGGGLVSPDGATFTETGIGPNPAAFRQNFCVPDRNPLFGVSVKGVWPRDGPSADWHPSSAAGTRNTSASLGELVSSSVGGGGGGGLIGSGRHFNVAGSRPHGHGPAAA
ncbi:hypothetical protein WMF39_01255 [Sorangium sp. So ce1504]|uniref:hypothetical protein n=1 Tax=Sorangium sp. So ce1504 TaxID=3133337 RepID=UPI003F5E6B31